MKKRGQVGELPFGLIFSIFLIIAFIVVFFIVLAYVMGWGSCTETGYFYDGLQQKINEAYSSQIYDDFFEADLKKIQKICFANLSSQISPEGEEDWKEIRAFEGEDGNLFLIPPQEACNMPYKLIEHINISLITKDKNPYCVDASRKLRIKKDVYDSLVLIE